MKPMARFTKSLWIGLLMLAAAFCGSRNTDSNNQGSGIVGNGTSTASSAGQTADYGGSPGALYTFVGWDALSAAGQYPDKMTIRCTSVIDPPIGAVVAGTYSGATNASATGFGVNGEGSGGISVLNTGTQNSNCKYDASSGTANLSNGNTVTSTTSGFPASTTIASVDSATQITLAANATSSATSVAFTANGTTKFGDMTSGSPIITNIVSAGTISGIDVDALDGTGKSSIKVFYEAAQISDQTREFGIQLQYECDGSGTYAQVPASVDFRTSDSQVGTSTRYSQMGPYSLPAACNNNSAIKLRWRYYYLSGASGSRTRIALRNIRVSTDTTATTFAGLSTATASDYQTVNLTWPAATDDVTTASYMRYDIYQATSSGGYGTSAYGTQPTVIYSIRGTTSTTITGLNASTNYFFVIRARDEQGNRNASGVINTGSETEKSVTTPADPTPPSVASFNPANSTNYDMSINTVSVTFDKAMAPASVTTTTLKVVAGTDCSTGALSASGVAASGGNTIFTLTLTTARTAGNTYTTCVMPGANSASGVSIAAQASASWTAVAVANFTTGQVVINEVHVSPTPAAEEYIELYNTTGSPISLNGAVLWYKSAAGTPGQATTLTGTIPANGYYTVLETASPTSYTCAGTLQTTGWGNSGLSNTAGAVVLTVNGTTPTTTGDGNVRDIVQWGTNSVNWGEGGTTGPNTSGTKTMNRIPNGSDTNNTATDIVLSSLNNGTCGLNNSTTPFAVSSASATAHNKVDVVFNAAPTAGTGTTGAVNLGNYSIIAAASSCGAASLYTISNATLSTNTVTLTTSATQTPSTSYKVCVTNVTRSSDSATLSTDNASYTSSAAFNVNSASGASSTTVTVTFSSAPTAGTGSSGSENTANYSITGGSGLTVSNAVLSSNTVTLTTNAQVASQAYTVTVSNVIRADGAPLNTNSAAFTGYTGSVIDIAANTDIAYFSFGTGAAATPTTTQQPCATSGFTITNDAAAVTGITSVSTFTSTGATGTQGCVVGNGGTTSFSTANTGWDGTPSPTSKYWSYSITVASGYRLTLKTFSAAVRVSGTGPKNLGLYYSVDSYGSVLSSFVNTTTSFANWGVSGNLSSLGTITGPATITFRIAPTDTVSQSNATTASGGVWRMDEVKIISGP